MSLIDAVDDFHKNKTFRKDYYFLCEFCHPNFFGITLGSRLNSVGIMRYNKLAVLSEEDFDFVRYQLLNCSFLFEFYDMLFKLLNSNEELPIVLK